MFKFLLPLNLQFFAAEGEEGGQGNPQEAPKDEPKQDEVMIPKQRFDEVNSKYKEMASQLAKLQEAEALRQAEMEEQQRKQAEEQGKYQELYEGLQKELETTQSKVSRAAELENLINGMVEQKLEKIPKEYVDLIPENLAADKKLEWLNKAEEKGLFAPKEVKEIGKPSNTTPKQQKVDSRKMSPLDKIVAGLGK